ncbi:hypothetical protein Rsub_04796 [Raphidocelis subcapitata]|uniref:DUF4050 domain-containing protein n=1 Tax=Raphidocelis subcapitata TaxID=307507 RepID=A0A2V0P1Q8_9CHLO|nr:hypothetical protein Rsub_04796 [Raphidocelis subcapitata]|eukprot:GBF91127.1 hypothetical protein Rsub_04796 [Raphidocelis subcapitata]
MSEPDPQQPSPAKPEAKSAPDSQPEGQNGTQETFHNRGLEIWIERQRQWRSDGSSEQDDSKKRKRTYSPTVTVEELLSFQPLPHPVPLEEAVELLAELWESEEPF